MIGISAFAPQAKRVGRRRGQKLDLHLRIREKKKTLDPGCQDARLRLGSAVKDIEVSVVSLISHRRSR
jgi:hypothetical protein